MQHKKKHTTWFLSAISVAITPVSTAALFPPCGAVSTAALLPPISSASFHTPCAFAALFPQFSSRKQHIHTHTHFHARTHTDTQTYIHIHTCTRNYTTARTFTNAKGGGHRIHADARNSLFSASGAAIFPLYVASFCVATSSGERACMRTRVRTDRQTDRRTERQRGGGHHRLCSHLGKNSGRHRMCMVAPILVLLLFLAQSGQEAA